MKGVIKQKKGIWKQTIIVIPIKKVITIVGISIAAVNLFTFVVKYSITTQIKTAAAPKNQNPNIKR